MMQAVCVLGNGQLGRMLRQAGEPLGIAVYPVDAEIDPNSVPYQQAVITAEIERWPDTAFTRELAAHPTFVNRDIFTIIADRLTQKQLLDSLALPTAPWQALQDSQQWPTLFAQLGQSLIVKRRSGGYDGRGQWCITQSQTTEIPAEIYQQAIVEQAIKFEDEVSLIGARNRRGEMVFYPLTHNLHQDGILKISLHQANKFAAYQQQAEQMLAKIMQQLNYVGVMAMECFKVGDQLLINELAPRVHNSGHWTQNGASISQFELHLRAILDLPLPKPVVQPLAVMVNLIGTAYNSAWLAQPLVQLHWYDKVVRGGRKVGHINLVHQQPQTLQQTLQQLSALLPAEYQTALHWAQQQLSA